ncbi:unnamed protein product [Dibothriocephalus latus]|uniref:SMP-LTD domain-containing protein n=1 Tax=Dibothriocephalus latus TaxID=60516 RepID=A0A3P7L6N7_DIBLA|nr:unnamed protein product [Dibothriocephalus latus]
MRINTSSILTAANPKLSAVDKFADLALRLFLEGADELKFPPTEIALLGKIDNIKVRGLSSAYRACPIRLEEAFATDTKMYPFSFTGCIGASNISLDLRIKNNYLGDYELGILVKPFTVKFSFGLLPEHKPRVAVMERCELAEWNGFETDNDLLDSILQTLAPKQVIEHECKWIANMEILPNLFFPNLVLLKEMMMTMMTY